MENTNIEGEFANMVHSLVKPGSEILHSMTPQKAHLNHMAMGVAGEGGELLDAIKRFTIYNKPLDLENVIEELGDIEFYLQGIRTGLELTREEILIANVAKLSKRYKSGKYSDKQAIAREDKQ